MYIYEDEVWTCPIIFNTILHVLLHDLGTNTAGYISVFVCVYVCIKKNIYLWSINQKYYQSKLYIIIFYLITHYVFNTTANN